MRGIKIPPQEFSLKIQRKLRYYQKSSYCQVMTFENVNASGKRDHFGLFHRIFQFLAIFTIPYLSNHQ